MTEKEKSVSNGDKANCSTPVRDSSWQNCGEGNWKEGLIALCAKHNITISCTGNECTLDFKNADISPEEFYKQNNFKVGKQGAKSVVLQP